MVNPYFQNNPLWQEDVEIDVLIEEEEKKEEQQEQKTPPETDLPEEVVENLKENVEVEEKKKSYDPQSPEVFAIQKATKEIDLLDNVQAWLSARCLQLNNMEVFAKFVLDFSKLCFAVNLAELYF